MPSKSRRQILPVACMLSQLVPAHQPLDTLALTERMLSRTRRHLPQLACLYSQSGKACLLVRTSCRPCPVAELNQGGAVAGGMYAPPPGTAFPTPMYVGPVGAGGQQIQTAGAAARPVGPTGPAIGYLGQVGANAQQGGIQAAASGTPAAPSRRASGTPENRPSVSKKHHKSKTPQKKASITQLDGPAPLGARASARPSLTTAASASSIYAPQAEQTTTAPPGFLGPIDARDQQNEIGGAAYVGPAGVGAQPFQGGAAAYPYPYQFQQGMPNAYGPMPPMQAGDNSGRPIYQIFYNPFSIAETIAECSDTSSNTTGSQ
ncbi:hypothetical protein MRX96_015489 [Rhipicephalus microplus]